jgi:hypothetical protein
MPIEEIEPIDVLGAVRKIEAKGNLESARRTLQLASGISLCSGDCPHQIRSHARFARRPAAPK